MRIISSLLLSQIIKQTHKVHLKSLTKLEYMSTPIKHENQEVYLTRNIESHKWEALDWIDLNIPSNELRISTTLNTGQCFNWKKLYTTSTDESWLGMLESDAYILRQTEQSIHCARLPLVLPISKMEGVKEEAVDARSIPMREFFGRYFQTDEFSIRELYSHWSDRCPRMRVVCNHVPGLRVVRQDPFECLISFICSSNNNISRIILMLERLRFHYGKYSMTVRLQYPPGHSSIDSPPESIYVHYNPQSFIVGGMTPVTSSSASLEPIPIINGRPMQPHLASPSPKKSLKRSSTMTDHESDAVANSPSMDNSNYKRKQMDEHEHEHEHDNNDSTDSNVQQFHLFQFPTAEALSAATEADLRSLGMGYRAKFIVESAKIAAGKPHGAAAWFAHLRSLANSDTTPLESTGGKDDDSASAPRKRKKTVKQTQSALVKTENQDCQTAPSLPSRLFVQQELLQFPGVGRKVADCVALFSLDQRAAIPVDTHVWDIATRDYAPSLLKSKSLTPTIYEAVGDVFRKIFGAKAGWAHSVLFAAELPEFRKALPADMQAEMKHFTEANKKLKKDQKDSTNLTKKKTKKEAEGKKKEQLAEDSS